MNFHSISINVLRLCLWLVLLSALFIPLERLFSVRPQSILRRETLLDLSYYFINSLLPALLLGLPMSLVAVAGQHILPMAVSSTLGGLPIALKLLLSLVIGEIGFYWAHRLCHQIGWLWGFHSLHHSAEHLYFLVNTRAHPVDIVFTRLVGLTPLYVLGLAGPSAAGSATPAAVILIGTVWGFFIHADLCWRLRPLESLVATPIFHHWHHSRVDHINHNYASMLPVLDRLFGTLHMPGQWPPDYGITEPLPGSLGGQLIEPLLPARK